MALDSKKEFRFRVGQSKVTYGFENMQSSQNRLSFDRVDALNSYWASVAVRERFAYLVKSGLKGSGNYGIFGLGVYNGQTVNRAELKVV